MDAQLMYDTAELSFFIWASYGVAGVIFLALLLLSWRRLHVMRRKLPPKDPA